MKQCTECLEIKEKKEFYVRSASRDGLTSRCKICLCNNSRTSGFNTYEYRKKWISKYNNTAKGKDVRVNYVSLCQKGTVC